MQSISRIQQVGAVAPRCDPEVWLVVLGGPFAVNTGPHGDTLLDPAAFDPGFIAWGNSPKQLHSYCLTHSVPTTTGIVLILQCLHSRET